jgi:hypothetical protein
VRIVASGWLALAFCLSISSARAEHEAATFSLEYSVPAECPERAAFVSSLVSRSRGAHEQVHAPRVALAVVLDGDRERSSGTFGIKLADGQESRREIPAAACAQVLSSIALIAAMILDGGGLDDPPPSTSLGEPMAPLSPAPAMHATGPAPAQRIPERANEPRLHETGKLSGVWPRLQGSVRKAEWHRRWSRVSSQGSVSY